MAKSSIRAENWPSRTRNDMVTAMPSDRGLQRRVAWITALIAGCGPYVMPKEISPESEGVASGRHAPHKLQAAGDQQVVIGEMCPQGAMGRPGVVPLVMRTLDWTDAQAEIASTIERGSVPRFTVFGADGKAAGAFDTLGLVDVGMAQEIVSGGYTGAPVCSYQVAGGKAGAGTGGTRAEDPACTAALMNCGLAVATLTRPDDPIETPSFKTGGACVVGDSLAVDVDGDGTAELFPLSEVLDGVRSPTSEWTAGPVAGAPCTPKFQVYDIPLHAPPEPGAGPDPKATVMMDVLGIVDLDGDGRREVIVAFRFATSRSLVVYSAPAQAQRLELAGEGTTFPR
jgi:hypothetical protein